MVSIDVHPLLDAAVFSARFPKTMQALAVPEAISALLKPAATAPLTSNDEVRAAVRELLRHGGYKPTGRGKPASEYLIRAVGEGALSSINAAVDTCNAVSLHSGLPVSVIDLGKTRGPFRIGLADTDSTYVFNASGQTIDVEGLLCLFDADGPCANAVKDSQRTKTNADTTETLTVIWGTRALPGRTAQTLEWYRELLQAQGAQVEVLL